MGKAFATALAAYLGVLGFFGYVHLWERNQPVQEFRDRKVSKVEHCGGRNEFGFSSGIYKIFVNEETRPIYLDYNPKIKKGDLVNLKVRRGFPMLEDHLDAILD
ncbi:hypothetical protein J4429_04725 [Candidatus Pacearchaeota archaeon]|nr:hypothetical protein [Candidatus Pacearchaeota archaeon]